MQPLAADIEDDAPANELGEGTAADPVPGFQNQDRKTAVVERVSCSQSCRAGTDDGNVNAGCELHIGAERDLAFEET